ncbi:MAG: FecR domain-containing protein [Proteobacteria bacterium]|nr:FecR domain-containing protein [Pseudomonadota bacterium]
MRRSVLALLGVLVVIATMAVVGSGLPSRGGDELVLAEVFGAVELDRDGSTHDAEIGRVLTGHERVRTGAGGRAVLSLGADTRIRVGASTELEIVAVGADGVDLELEGGAVQATVRPTSRAVRVGALGRQVQATDADFAVAVEDDVLWIESRRGALMAQGVPGVNTLSEGARVVVEGDATPEVLPIPEDLLLAVDWPEERRTRAEVAEVRGMTSPRARVRVLGAGDAVETQADADGAFLARLPLDEGENAVQVQAVDLFGDEVEVEVVLVRDTRGPVFRGGVQ